MNRMVNSPESTWKYFIEDENDRSDGEYDGIADKSLTG